MKILLSLLLIFSVFTTYAQPVNDNCDGAIVLQNVSNYCSDIAEFTNIDATLSGFGNPTCFPGDANDVWFSFTATALDVVISINGNSFGSPGGTLNNPEIVLYSGDCAVQLNQEACIADDLFSNIIELYKGAMNIGETYYIRVAGMNGQTGSFQICINNFNPTGDLSGDCGTSLPLCTNNTSFNVNAVTGQGNVFGELDDATCFQGLVGESNVTWFTWTCDVSGSLVFTLNPNNPNDDLDFVVYELPNGQGDCSDKIILRCMAAGDFVATSPCMGPTGLQEGSTDFEQPPGCPFPESDNWLAPVQMTAGTSYAIAVNNFTSSGNGFNFELGGTGTFIGPSADFTLSTTADTICAGETITFTDASTFLQGNVTGWSWIFGSSASMLSSTEQGPHDISFSTPGLKTISLSIQTDLGCEVTVTRSIYVEQCCYLTASVESTDPSCLGDDDGTGTISLTDATEPVTYTWSNGQTTATATDLTAGTYYITSTDAFGCIHTDSVVINDGPELELTASEDTTIFQGASVSLDAASSINNATINWTATDFSQVGPGIIVSPEQTTTYTATASLGGCSVSEDVLVTVNPVKFDIPNAFSPNGDEINDAFGGVGEGVEILEFKIFDRWGELVWDNPTQKWDGKQNGTDMPVDVYLYTLRVKFQDGTEELKKGDFTLLR
jgi:gliding motility-associated-like protein